MKRREKRILNACRAIPRRRFNASQVMDCLLGECDYEGRRYISQPTRGEVESSLRALCREGYIVSVGQKPRHYEVVRR
ncbi:MAG: hypothetical protein PHZ19_00380 [Candidatus Thermoplasmatota archaeon]|nr:hypothetical protein [Candidatus Thermoplasmatota archaeon]